MGNSKLEHKEKETEGNFQEITEYIWQVSFCFLQAGISSSSSKGPVTAHLLLPVMGQV